MPCVVDHCHVRNLLTTKSHDVLVRSTATKLHEKQQEEQKKQQENNKRNNTRRHLIRLMRPT